MVVKSPVFVPGDDQEAAWPHHGIANRLIRSLNESFSVRYICQGMLRRAVLIVVQYVVARFDEDVAERKPRLSEIIRKFGELPNIPQLDAFESRDHGKIVARIEAPLDSL